MNDIQQIVNEQAEELELQRKQNEEFASLGNRQQRRTKIGRQMERMLKAMHALQWKRLEYQRKYGPVSDEQWNKVVANLVNTKAAK